MIDNREGQLVTDMFWVGAKIGRFSGGGRGFLTSGKVNCHIHGLGVGAKIGRFSGRRGGEVRSKSCQNRLTSLTGAPARKKKKEKKKEKKKRKKKSSTKNRCQNRPFFGGEEGEGGGGVRSKSRQNRSLGGPPAFPRCGPLVLMLATRNPHPGVWVCQLCGPLQLAGGQIPAAFQT